MKTKVVNKRDEDFDVFIGRPSKWGNPYSIGPDGGREMVIRKYAEWIQTQPHLLEALPELYGKRLGCYCKPQSCHGDVLMKLAEEQRIEKFKTGSAKVAQCQKCHLWKTRTNTVFGMGSPSADILFVGEGPGEKEDETGLPFQGRAGTLLNKWIEVDLEMTREDVYIANIVKCRPPGNRDPYPEEAEACRPFLDKQIEIIQPKIIITLGRIAAIRLLNDTEFKITKHHGIWRKYNEIDLMPIYHPAFLLRQMSDANKQAVKSDLAKVIEKLKG